MTEKVTCIYDAAFLWTTDLNNYFAEHLYAKHAFMIICGLMMDVMVVVSLYRFAIHGSTWRFPIALLAFYGFRASV